MTTFPMVPISLLGWPLLMACLVAFMPVRRVVLVSIIGGYLFLPQAGLFITGFPDYTKPVAVGLGALAAALLGAAPQMLSWRPKLIDVFFLGFVIAPGISSLLNGLGAYDATSSVFTRFIEWGVAYWVGRALFTGGGAMREVAVGIVVGGLVYAPLCVWESVMSPQLHLQIYGFRASPWVMSLRFGGYRPTVFLPHGLAVGVWMASSALVAWVLWRSRAMVRIFSIPMMWIAVGLVIVTIFLRSAGAALLLVGMIGAVELVQVSRLRLTLLLLLLLPTGYIGLRVAGWHGEQLVGWASTWFGDERAGSLNMRLENDKIILERAMQRPVFGWGGWGRWRVHDEFGNDITVSDSLWGILVGSTGLFGLVSVYGMFMTPMFLFVKRRVRYRVFDVSSGAAWAVGMAILLFILDTLLNAMPNTIFILAAGAMSSFVLRPWREVVVGSAVPGMHDQQRSSSAHLGGNRGSFRAIDLR